MTAPYVGIIPEGGRYPEPWNHIWDYCPRCGSRSSPLRLTTGYSFHVEHVVMECRICHREIVRFDVLTEANLTFDQLPPGPDLTISAKGPIVFMTDGGVTVVPVEECDQPDFPRWDP